MNRVIFSQPWGGLGDNLSFSNLPRLYNEVGSRFHLSVINNCRSDAIEEICWDSNKFVKKSKKIVPNIGYKTMIENDFKLSNKKYNIIQNINTLHGFYAGSGYPEVNLKNFQKLGIAKYELILDLNASSLFSETKNSYNIESLTEVIGEFQSKDALDIIYPNIYSSKIPISNNSNLEIQSLDHLIEILLLTNVFVCFNSGSHVLASAVKKLTGRPNNIVSFNSVDDGHFLIKNGSIEEKFGSYYFDNVNYLKIKTEKAPSNDEFKNTIQNFASETDYYKKLHALFFNPAETIFSFLKNKTFKK